MRWTRIVPIVAGLAVVWSADIACSTPSSGEAEDSTERPADRSQQRTGVEPGRAPSRSRRFQIPGVDAETRTPDELRGRLAEMDAGTDGSDAAFERRPVTFRAGDLELHGTLTLPRSGDDSHPAVVLVHGSGPLSRHSYMSGQFMTHFGFEIPVFVQLESALARAGYAVLRYDKRNCRGEVNRRCSGNGYPPLDDGATVGRFVEDAAAALRWLRDRPFTDDDRIYTVGHGQGGTFVPVLMQELDWLAGGALLGTPHGSVDEMYRTQATLMREMLREGGMPEDRIRELDAMQRIDRMADALERLRNGSFAKERLAGASLTFWQSWLQIGDAAPRIAGTLDRPLLILSGSYDYNVPPSQTEQWRSALDTSDEGPGHEVAILDCVTHALNCIREPNPMEVEPDDLTRKVDRRVTDALVAFLERTAR